MIESKTHKAIALLERLIATPSVSREEAVTADILEQHLADEGIAAHRDLNNVWATNLMFDHAKPTILLCSHHDTVRPAATYTTDPFTPTRSDDRIIGLGSNDAGASVVSLTAAFTDLYAKELPYNLILALVAEEEVSGANGLEHLLATLTRQVKIDMAIIGEPTGLQPAIAERGLVVLDCVAHGVAGHAARNEGVNALYIALDDIATLRDLKFEKTSPTLGPIKITVTQIQAGSQHNVVPDECRFTADVRTTDAYTNEQTVKLIREAVKSDVIPRSTRLNPSVISADHPLVKAVEALGLTPFVSPTMSDMVILRDIPSIKIGPGDSARSHTADEYIHISEISDGINIYIKLLKSIQL